MAQSSTPAATRLDQALVRRALVSSRSQAESYIKLGVVSVNGKVVLKPGRPVDEKDDIRIDAVTQYVSRAALKLASVTQALSIDFQAKTVLDIGSSTGGFTQFALLNGATRVIAVDVGSDQLHPSLRNDVRIELHEKTDIRGFDTDAHIDIVLADVSFISLRHILPAIDRLLDTDTVLVTMVKPQFEAEGSGVKHKGVIKNKAIRRKILHDFEDWAAKRYVILNKADSTVAGSKGNVERFYLLKRLSRT